MLTLISKLETRKHANKLLHGKIFLTNVLGFLDFSKLQLIHMFLYYTWVLAEVCSQVQKTALDEHCEAAVIA